MDSGLIGYLDKNDLSDWREHQALLASMDMNIEKYSANETEAAHLRNLVMLSRFYDNYGLDKTRMYEFSPVTGAIMEAVEYSVGLEEA